MNNQVLGCSTPLVLPVKNSKLFLNTTILKVVDLRNVTSLEYFPSFSPGANSLTHVFSLVKQERPLFT